MAAVAIRLVGGYAFPDYDALFALIWGHGLAHGHGPDYAIPFRPAAHPLLLLLTTAASPLGREGAADVVRWVALLGTGLFVAAVWRLGSTLFGAAAGVVAAVIVFTRSATWGFGLLAYADAWAAAFVLYAAALEAERPRRGGPVFALLAAAGLIRPEVWLMAAAYWAWCASGGWSRGLRLVPLAALGPLVWLAFDLVTSGKVFATLLESPSTPPGTVSTAGHGIGATPDALVRFVGGFLRPPEAIAAAVGLALALSKRDRRIALPLAIAALNVIAFELVALRHGPLEQRYLFVACASGAMLAAYAVTAVTERTPAWPRVVGALLALACLAYAPVDIGRLGDLRDEVRLASHADRQLTRLTKSAAPCLGRSTLQLTDVRLRPLIAYYGGIDESRVVTTAAPTSLTPLGGVSRQLVSRSLPSDPDLRSARREWRLEGSCARQ